MDYMDPDVCCPKKAVKLNHSLTHSCTLISFSQHTQKYILHIFSYVSYAQQTWGLDNGGPYHVKPGYTFPMQMV